MTSLFIYLFVFTPDVTEFRIDIIHILINLPITPKNGHRHQFDFVLKCVKCYYINKKGDCQYVYKSN